MIICTVEGCTDAHNAKGLCNTHYNRWKRHRSLEKPARPSQSKAKNPNWRGDSAAYTTVHSRLRVARGSASNFDCIECGRQARDWAYTHDCPNQKESYYGPYSDQLIRYQPMCRSCHKKFDYHAGQVPA